MDQIDPARYLKDRYQLVQAGNKFIDEYKPREIAKIDEALAKQYL